MKRVTDKQVESAYRDLTARERALMMLSAMRTGEEPDWLLRSSRPPNQVDAFNGWIHFFIAVEDWYDREVSLLATRADGLCWKVAATSGFVIAGMVPQEELEAGFPFQCEVRDTWSMLGAFELVTKEIVAELRDEDLLPEHLSCRLKSTRTSLEQAYRLTQALDGEQFDLPGPDDATVESLRARLGL